VGQILQCRLFLIIVKMEILLLTFQTLLIFNMLVLELEDLALLFYNLLILMGQILWIILVFSKINLFHLILR